MFATDEPADITGISPTTILVRRIKQGVAEWFRLQLKEKAWKGLKEHTTEGWNLGPVPYGYLPDRVPHPNPFKAAQGRTKTRLMLDPDRAPIVAQIYTWRTEDKLGVNAITGRLNAYPQADPAAGWSIGTDPALLDQLPELAGRLDDLPERIQAELFAAFDIQILWNPPMKQATFFATITGTTPGIVAALLDRANDDDPATATVGTDPDQAPASTGTFSVPTRSGMCRKVCP